MNIDTSHPLYKQYTDDFTKRTGLSKIPNNVHIFLKEYYYKDAYSMIDKEYPKFSCWSGRLVDFCYIWSVTWDKNIKIKDITLPMFNYSDHLPVIIDIELPLTTQILYKHVKL